MDRHLHFSASFVRLTAVLALCCTLAARGYSQVSVKDSVVRAPMFNFDFSVQFPGGDMAKRYNTNYTLGASFTYKDQKNFLYGLRGHFLWADNLNVPGLLDGLMTERGEVIDQTGEYAFIRLGERGYHFGVEFGKQFPIGPPNPNCGIFVMGGLGFLEHWIKIDVEDEIAPQLRGDYLKLYDHRTNGLALSQTIGYRYLGNSRLVNFYVAIEAMQGFTKNRRSYNISTMGPDNTNRLDLFYGIKIGWSLPAYKRASEEFYFY